MKTFLLFIFILQLYEILSNYSYETIEEIVPKNIMFKKIDNSSFKIFKYIPLCTNSQVINSNKNINFQIIGEKIEIFIYDDYSLIEQNKNASFINYQQYVKVTYFTFKVFSFSISCEKEYYFVLSYTSNEPFYDPIYAQFSIIDSTNDIKISPLLSDSFIFHQRKEKEVIFYSYNETKYGLFVFDYYTKVQIFKNDIIIYNKEKTEDNYKEYLCEFEKNQNYTIYFENNKDFIFTLQLFNESNIFKHDFKTGPILFYKSMYYYEIDISNYKVNDIILFQFHTDMGEYTFNYQYKSNFNGNNFIELGLYKKRNYIPIKKTIEDSSLIIYIKFYLFVDELSILELIPNKVEEIKSNYNQIIKEPKYFYIDYFEINNMNSIGIGANDSFIFNEQEKSYENRIINKGLQNYYITKTNNNSPEAFRSIIIYINSNNNILFEVKKFNYSIFQTNTGYDFEYFQLCQGDNSLSELYFYISSYEGIGKELFTSVFGKFDAFYIKEEEIKNLSDFDFDKIKENNFYQAYKNNGYLKIKCNSPLMLKHTFLGYFYQKNLTANTRYYLNDNHIRGN